MRNNKLGYSVFNEKEEVLADIEVFEKYNQPIPHALLEKKRELFKSDLENQLQVVIRTSIEDSEYYKGFELLVYREGKCMINNFYEYYDEERFIDLKREEKTFLKYHAAVPDSMKEEILEMTSIKLLSEFLKERVQDLADDIGIDQDYLVKVSADGIIYLEASFFDAIPDIDQ